MRRRRIVQIATAGHGAWHLENLLRLQASDRIAVAGLCRCRPAQTALRARFPGVPVTSDAGELLTEVSPDITVISTSPHTHHDLAMTALWSSSHVLLEKPPVTTQADHDHLVSLQHELGRAVQVEFQSFGSLAIPAAQRLLEEGAIGELAGIGVAGA